MDKQAPNRIVEPLPSAPAVRALSEILRMSAERELLPAVLREVAEVVGAAGARIWWRARAEFPVALWASLNAPPLEHETVQWTEGAWQTVWNGERATVHTCAADLPPLVLPQDDRETEVEVWALIPSGTRARGVFVLWWQGTPPPIADVDRELLREALSAFAAQIWWRERWSQRMLERELLDETNRLLAQSLDRGEVLDKIFDLLGRVVHYDAGGIFLIDHDSAAIGQITARGYDPALQADLHLKIGQGLVGFVAETGQPVNVRDVASDSRYINARPQTRSALVVPIDMRGKRLGVLNLESDRPDAYDPNDVWLLSAFANQVAVTLDRARLFDRLLRDRGLREQISVARSIQESFLPHKAPTIEGYDIAGANFPSEEVGGDYFDFVPIVAGQWGVAIADVSGKGIPAALIMAGFRASLIAEIRNNYAIRTIFRKVNNVLREMTANDNFITAFYGVLDAKNRVLTFSNGGHNPPILLRADGAVERLSEGGPLVGVIKDTTYAERPVWLGPGDVLVLYTDGVTEAIDPAEEEFGDERLIALVSKHRDAPAATICEIIHDTVTEFAGPESHADDITLIVIKIL